MKIHDLLYKLSYKLKQKGLYYELKPHIKNNNSYIKLMFKSDRGIGKTYTLIKLSEKYNMPVLVHSENFKRMLQSQYPKAKVISPSDIRGARIGMTLLIDEEQMLSKHMREYIDDNFTQIGFYTELY